MGKRDAGCGGGERRPRTFIAQSIKIVDGWLERQQKASGGGESPNSWFKREAYRMLRDYVDRGKADYFVQAAKKEGHGRISPAALANPFNIGLMAMFTAEEPLTRGDRKVFADQMLYAYEHDVPAEFLVAFIGTAGSPAQIARKLADKSAVEPSLTRVAWHKRANRAQTLSAVSSARSD